MSSEYNEKSIKVLDEITHVKTNPSMYIGETSNPVHLVEEALDNALDESLNGFATIIAITVDSKTGKTCIIDNGRGIPYKDDIPKLISTKLFSGAKFNNGKNSYQICSGLHGVGLVCINALSKNYKIEIHRDNQFVRYTFENGIFKSKSIEEYVNKEIPFSTKIEFIADSDIFETIIPDINRIRNRLLNASVELPNCVFVLYIDDKKEVIKLTKDTFFKQKCLMPNDVDLSNIFDFEVSDKTEKFNVRFCYSYNGIGNINKIQSSVNLLPVEQGGVHVNIFMDILRDYFLLKSKKFGFHFLPQDIFVGLRCYFSLSIIKPEFVGQTKNKLSNKREYFSKLQNKLKIVVESYFSKNTKDLKDILEFLALYRKKQDSKKLKINNQNGKRGSVKFTKLRDCTEPNGELLLCEGESASGSLISCRNPAIHAILPLKGKIPSVITKKDILSNKEISELMEALGTGIEPNCDITKIKYSKIICAADADPDGDHIASLLTMVFAILTPEIIKQGYFYIAKTPLYAIKDKKTFIPIWSKDELQKARDQNKYILRVKGLGELNSSEAKQVLLDPKYRKLIPITYTSDIAKISELFNNVSVKRELLENLNITQEEQF